MTQKSPKKILLFGTFDGLHPGHLYFIKEAKKLGDVFISVSSDTNVIQLKGKKPIYSEKIRKKEIEKLCVAKKVFIGEKQIESWNVLQKLKPDIIALGYDQKALYTSLRPLTKTYGFKIKKIKSYMPKKFHSSIIKKETSKKKTDIIVLYGTMAVGKLTTGTLLAKKLGFKLTHNHLINNLVTSVFERGALETNQLLEKIRFEFYDFCARNNQNIIITHCYSHDYVSPTGLSDPAYMQKLEKIFLKNKKNALFIHLQADNQEVLKRVTNNSRKKYKKLTDPAIMKEYLKKHDFRTSAPVKNNLVIKNSNLTPKETVNLIIKYLN